MAIVSVEFVDGRQIIGVHGERQREGARFFFSYFFFSFKTGEKKNSTLTVFYVTTLEELLEFDECRTQYDPKH